VFAVTRRVRAAVIGGLLFAVAPVHAEVVAAINYREDLEAAVAVLGLLAWLFYPRCKPTPNTNAIAAGLLAIGLFAKENAIVLFPLAAAIAMTRFRFTEWARARRATLGSLGAVTLVWGAWRAGKVGGRDDIPGVARSPRVMGGSRTALRGEASLNAIFPFDWSPDCLRGRHGALAPGARGLARRHLVLIKHRRFRVVAAGLATALVAL
jgi:hypothetical protein